MRLKSLLLISLFFLFARSAAAQVNPLEWNTNGIQTSPLTSVVLAQFVNNDPSAESHNYHFVIASSVTALVFLEQIAADGTTVIRTQAYAVLAFVTFEGMKGVITLDAGERIRIRTDVALTGRIQGSIFLDS